VYISKTTTTTFEERHKLTVFHYVTKELTGLGIVSHSATWHINDFTFTVGTGTFVYSTVLTIACKYMTLVFQVKQRPIITVTAQNDVTTLSAVTTVGTTVGNIFRTMKVRHSTTTAA
jgi:hypothetical protein